MIKLWKMSSFSNWYNLKSNPVLWKANQYMASIRTFILFLVFNWWRLFCQKNFSIKKSSCYPKISFYFFFVLLVFCSFVFLIGVFYSQSSEIAVCTLFAIHPQYQITMIDNRSNNNDSSNILLLANGICFSPSNFIVPCHMYLDIGLLK